MADNLKHRTVGVDLDQDEFEAEDLHQIGGVNAGLVIDGKVDKISGKGLSTEDYTTAEQTKLAGIDAEAVALATGSIEWTIRGTILD